MRIFLIRHGLAEERAEFAASGLGDEQRPLTDRGRSRMRRGVQGLQRMIPKIEIIATSPYRRAEQTAEIVHRQYPNAALQTLPSLAPGRGPKAVTNWLREQDPLSNVALVGHEPDLSRLIAHLTAGSSRPFTALAKGGLCVLDTDGRPEGGGAVMQALVPPDWLRKLRLRKPPERK
jgi:phosphohistidine phosphatase